MNDVHLLEARQDAFAEEECWGWCPGRHGCLEAVRGNNNPRSWTGRGVPFVEELLNLLEKNAS